MNIAVFGGTGRTGTHVVQQALAAGHQVTALARSPGKLSIQHEALAVQQGDAADPAAVSAAIAGADAVISVLGPTKGQAPGTITRATGNILAAMRQHGVKRLVMSAGAGVGDPQDEPTLISRVMGFLLKLTAREVYEDMLQAVEAVRASDLGWTIVRVPMLHEGPGSGGVRSGYLGGDVGARLSRAAMAAFMLEQIDSDQYVHEAPVISD